MVILRLLHDAAIYREIVQLCVSLVIHIAMMSLQDNGTCDITIDRQPTFYDNRYTTLHSHVTMASTKRADTRS